MPYDIVNTPLGFAFVLAGQQIGGFSGCMSVTLSITVHVTLNFYVMAAISDLQLSFRGLDEFMNFNVPSSVKKATIYCRLIEILRLHRWIIR